MPDIERPKEAEALPEAGERACSCIYGLGRCCAAECMQHHERISRIALERMGRSALWPSQSRSALLDTLGWLKSIRKAVSRKTRSARQRSIGPSPRHWPRSPQSAQLYPLFR